MYVNAKIIAGEATLQITLSPLRLRHLVDCGIWDWDYSVYVCVISPVLLQKARNLIIHDTYEMRMVR